MVSPVPLGHPRPEGEHGRRPRRHRSPPPLGHPCFQRSDLLRTARMTTLLACHARGQATKDPEFCLTSGLFSRAGIDEATPPCRRDPRGVKLGAPASKVLGPSVQQSLKELDPPDDVSSGGGTPPQPSLRTRPHAWPAPRRRSHEGREVDEPAKPRLDSRPAETGR